MHRDLVKREVLHADETTCQVLREKGKPHSPSNLIIPEKGGMAEWYVIHRLLPIYKPPLILKCSAVFITLFPILL